MRQVLYFLLTIALLLALGPVAAQQFQYDAAGRLISAVYESGGSIQYEYDANSNITRIQYQSGAPAPVAPDGVIDTPATDIAIDVGQSVDFTGSGSDPDNATPLTYLWNFGGGAANSTVEDPGATTFTTAGTYTVTFTVTDADGLADPTPDSVVITVNSASGGGGNGGKGGGGAAIFLPLVCLLVIVVRKRRALALAAILLAGAANAQVTWTEMTSGTTENLNDVWMESASLAYAVGDNGTALRFDGASWLPVNVGTPAHLNAVWGTSSSDVWIVGSAGTVFHFDGTAWSPVDIGAGTQTLNDVWVVGQTVYVVGSRGVWRGENGTWGKMSVKVSNTTSTLDPDHNMTSIRGSQNYRVMTANRSLGLDEGLFVSDGTFSNFDWAGLSTFDLNAVWVHDDTFMLAVGNTARRLNGGDPTSRSSADWQVYNIGIEGAAVWGSSPQSIWVAGRVGTSGRIMFGDGTTNDAWTPQLTVSFRQFRGLHGIDDQTLIAVGTLGTIYAAFAEAPAPPLTSSNFFYTHRNDDGVNTATGELVRSELDFALPGQVPLVFERYFSGFLGRNTDLPQPFGPGWSHPYNWAFVDNVGPNQVKVVDFRGTEYLFENNGAGYNLVSPGWANVGLVANGSELIFYDRVSSQRAILDATTGRLTEIKDRSGNSLLMNYMNGRLASISDTSGDLLNFSYNGFGQIDSIDVVRDSTLTRSFGYDANGNLVSTVSPQGAETRYSYDANGNFLSATYGVGTTDETNRYTYDYANRQVVRSNRNGGSSRDYSYDVANNRTTVTESGNGSTWVFEHNSANQLARTVNPTGSEQTYSYDSSGRQVASADGEGRLTQWSYDSVSGLVESITDPGGFQTFYVYRSRNLPDGVAFYDVEEIRHADGGITRLRYDANGNLVQLEDPEGIFTDFTYDAKGNMLSRKVGAGGTEIYTYNSRRQLVEFTDVNGNTTTYVHDAFGRVIEETSALGTRTNTYSNRVTPDQVETASGAVYNYSYDRLDRLARAEGPNGVYAANSFDASGNLVRRDFSGARVYDYEFDEQFRPTSESRNSTVVTTIDYDAANNPVLISDAGGDSVQIERDRSSKPIAVLQPNNERITLGRTGNVRGLIDTISRGFEFLTFAYDEIANVRTVADAAGRQLDFVRDKLGRIVQVNFKPLGISWFFGIDDIGNVVSITDPMGNVYSREYGGDEHVDSEQDALGNKTFFSRNGANQLTKITYADGLVVDILYGLNGFPSQIIGSDGTDYSITIGDDGRLLGGTNLSINETATGVVTESNGIIASTDDQDRVKSITIRSGASYEYTRNADGEVIRVEDSLGGITTIEWTALGNPARIVYPNGAITTFTWDQAGRLTGKSFSDLGDITATRDPMSGQLMDIESTVSASPEIPEKDITLQVGGGSQRSDATYNARNNVTRIGDTSLEWDAVSRLVKIDNPTESIEFKRDVLGRPVEKSVNGVPTTLLWTYSHDVAVVAAELDSAGNVVHTNVHLPGGQLLYRIDADGLRQYFHNDLDGNCIKITGEKGQVLASYFYTPTGDIMARYEAVDNDCKFGCQLGYLTWGDNIVETREGWFDAETGHHLNDHSWTYRLSLQWQLPEMPINSGRSRLPHSFTDNADWWNLYLDLERETQEVNEYLLNAATRFDSFEDFGPSLARFSYKNIVSPHHDHDVGRRDNCNDFILDVQFNGLFPEPAGERGPFRSFASVVGELPGNGEERLLVDYAFLEGLGSNGPSMHDLFGDPILDDYPNILEHHQPNDESRAISPVVPIPPAGRSNVRGNGACSSKPVSSVLKEVGRALVQL